MRHHLSRGDRRRSVLGILLAAVTIAATGILSFVQAPAASAATAATCSTADQGSGRYASTLCWFDFSGYDAAEAASASGQEMSVALPGGSTLTFTLTTSGGAIHSAAFPTYSGAYLGNGSYTGVSGQPALYQSRPRTTTQVTLSDIVLTAPSGERSTAFSFVGADAETSDTNESITWRSTNPIYSLTADGSDPGIGNACDRRYSGLGTREVVCAAGRSSVKTGTPIVASQAPDSFSQTMVGGGQQAVAFGVLLSQVELTKQVDSRVTGDTFEVVIEDEDGTRLFDASTGATGNSATTGEQTVIATDRGATFRFSENATSGSLDRYDADWTCTRNGADDPTLPSGTGVGTAAEVHVGIGDFVSCTIANDVKPTGIQLHKKAADPEDVNRDGIPDAGDSIQYTFDVTNTGDLPLTGVSVDDPKVGQVTCPDVELAPGDTITCTADAPYTVTADDQAAGAVENTATASGTTSGTQDRVVSNESSSTTPLIAPAPAIALVKLATPDDDESFVVGQTITYSFVVTNRGNVPLEDVTVDEVLFTGAGEMSSITCPATRLETDRSMTCTATYTLTQADIDATRVDNTARTTGTPVGGGDPVTAEADVQVPGLPAPAISLEKGVDPDTAHQAGDTVEYTFEVTNIGNVTLSDPQIDETSFTGTGGTPVATCPAGPLAPGESVDCTASYTLTQADVDAGRVDNTATATATPSAGDPPVSDPSSAIVTVPRDTGLGIVKTADTETYAEVGQTIGFSFVVTNTGNVSMTDVSVGEEEFTGSGTLSDISCPATALGGGESMTCTASYAVTQDDIDAGSIDNTATATGTPAGSDDPVTTPPSDVTVTAERSASLGLEKTADPTETSIGDLVTYSFTVTNTGTVSVVNPLVEETAFTGSGDVSDVYCPLVVLAPGESVDCVAYYEVTSADGAAGVVDNTAVATAQPPAGVDAPRSNESSASVRVLNPAIALEKTADRTGLTVGDTITYTFTVTNTGNVPLADVRVVEGEFTGSGELSEVSCPDETASLEPEASMTCTATYTVTQDDVDAGAVENTATAEGTPAVGDPVVSDPATVEITQAPVAGLDLVKTADRQKVTKAGQVITYSFVLTNTGTVTLSDPTVTEQEFTGHGTLSEVVCPADIRLLPGESVTCTATYEVVAADLTGEPLTNVATGTADDPTGTPTKTDESTVDVPTAKRPGTGLPVTGGGPSALAALTAFALLGIGAVTLVTARLRSRRQG